MKKYVSSFLGSDSGATLVEYGVALLVAIIVGGTGLSILGAEAEANMETARQEMPINN